MGGEKLMLECQGNMMFESRENMGDEETEEGKNRSHLSMPSMLEAKTQIMLNTNSCRVSRLLCMYIIGSSLSQIQKGIKDLFTYFIILPTCPSVHFGPDTSVRR